MSLLTDLLQRCRGVFRGGREDAETREELQFHLEMQTEKNLRAGMDPRQARRRAHARLGGVDAIREAVRDARGARPLDDLFRDLGYALRGARRHHGFSLVAVLTLTLGIGANTAVFTVVDSFLFRPPPFEHVERLVSIRDVNPAQGWMVEDNVPASPGRCPVPAASCSARPCAARRRRRRRRGRTGPSRPDRGRCPTRRRCHRPQPRIEGRESAIAGMREPVHCRGGRRARRPRVARTRPGPPISARPVRRVAAAALAR